MITRREFLKLSAAGTLGLYASVHGRFLPRAFAQIPGGTLEPASVPKYVTPLLIPPAMPRAGQINVKSGVSIDYYEIAMRQFPQQILPAGLPPTTVWGYGPRVAIDGPQIFNAPSLTIEARTDTPVRIKQRPTPPGAVPEPSPGEPQNPRRRTSHCRSQARVLAAGPRWA
jgi:hypothetical protein